MKYIKIRDFFLIEIITNIKFNHELEKMVLKTKLGTHEFYSGEDKQTVRVI